MVERFAAIRFTVSGRAIAPGRILGFCRMGAPRTSGPSEEHELQVLPTPATALAPCATPQTALAADACDDARSARTSPPGPHPRTHP